MTWENHREVPLNSGLGSKSVKKKGCRRVWEEEAVFSVGFEVGPVEGVGWRGDMETY